MAKPELDIARNVRTIEWLKAELVGGVSALFKALLKNSEDAILDALANVVVACYLLGKRLGIPFSRLDVKIENKVSANITKSHEIEQWYGDFSSFRRYLEERAGS
ncbi:MAG: MazG-like family protein [Bacillota bacterium]|nr:MazG-like family protein [Bacillota bacterium]